MNAIPPSGSQHAFWLLHGPWITFSSPVPSAFIRHIANGSDIVRFQLKSICLPSYDACASSTIPSEASTSLRTSPLDSPSTWYV